MENLLGLWEDEAVSLLKAKGLSYRLELTQAPDKPGLEKYENSYPRVIKQDIENGSCKLTVSMVPDDFRRFD